MKIWKAIILLSIISTVIVMLLTYGIQKYLEYKFNVIPTVPLNLFNMSMLSILVFIVMLIGMPILIERNSWKKV